MWGRPAQNWGAFLTTALFCVCVCWENLEEKIGGMPLWLHCVVCGCVCVWLMRGYTVCLLFLILGGWWGVFVSVHVHSEAIMSRRNSVRVFYECESVCMSNACMQRPSEKRVPQRHQYERMWARYSVAQQCSLARPNKQGHASGRTQRPLCEPPLPQV